MKYRELAAYAEEILQLPPDLADNDTAHLRDAGTTCAADLRKLIGETDGIAPLISDPIRRAPPKKA